MKSDNAIKVTPVTPIAGVLIGGFDHTKALKQRKRLPRFTRH